MSTAIRRALYGKMSGDTTLSNLLGSAAPGFTKAIYDGIAPEGSGYPYVIFNKSSGLPTYTLAGAVGKFESDVWMIKAVDRSDDSDKAEAIQARLDSLITDGTLTISGASLMLLQRISDIDFVEEVDRVRYYHRGSLFRLVYQ